MTAPTDIAPPTSTGQPPVVPPDFPFVDLEDVPAPCDFFFVPDNNFNGEHADCVKPLDHGPHHLASNPWLHMQVDGHWLLDPELAHTREARHES